MNQCETIYVPNYAPPKIPVFQYEQKYSKICSRCKKVYLLGKNQKNISFFRAPDDKILHEQWVHFIIKGMDFNGDEIKKKKTFIALCNTKHIYLCADHFLPTDYTNSKTRLKYGSIPSVDTKMLITDDQILTDLPEPEVQLEVASEGLSIYQKVLLEKIKPKSLQNSNVNNANTSQKEVPENCVNIEKELNQNEEEVNQNEEPTPSPVEEPFIKEEPMDEDEEEDDTDNRLNYLGLIENDHDYECKEVKSEPIDKEFAEQCLYYALEYLTQQKDVNFVGDMHNLIHLIEKLKNPS